MSNSRGQLDIWLFTRHIQILTPDLQPQSCFMHVLSYFSWCQLCFSSYPTPKPWVHYWLRVFFTLSMWNVSENRIFQNISGIWQLLTTSITILSPLDDYNNPLTVLPDSICGLSQSIFNIVIRVILLKIEKIALYLKIRQCNLSV